MPWEEKEGRDGGGRGLGKEYRRNFSIISFMHICLRVQRERGEIIPDGKCAGRQSDGCRIMASKEERRKMKMSN